MSDTPSRLPVLSEVQKPKRLVGELIIDFTESIPGPNDKIVYPITNKHHPWLSFEHTTGTCAHCSQTEALPNVYDYGAFNYDCGPFIFKHSQCPDLGRAVVAEMESKS